MGFLSKYFNKYIEQKFVDCPITFDYERCRTLGGLCEDICFHSCPTQAISLGNKKVDDSLCHGCGNCVTSCPNGAISFITLKDETLLRNIIHHGKDKTTVRFCCNHSDKYHLKSKNTGDSFDIEKLTNINVDCLSRLHSGLLLAPFAVNAQHVWVDTIGCEDCPKNQTGKVLENININFTEAMEWLTQLEIEEARLMLAAKLPEPVLIATKKQVEAESQFNRRAFFTNIGKGVKVNTVGIAGDVADQVLADEEKIERLKLAPNQRKNHPPVDRTILLQVVKKLASGRDIENELYHYEKMSISDNCNMCNICSRLCPTGAIQLIKSEERMVGSIGYLPSHCINCRKCVSVCPRLAISFHNKLLGEAFVRQELLPVVETELLKCKKCKDIVPITSVSNELCSICNR